MSKQKPIINSNNYLSIQAFMVNDLHLSGNELIVYAVIFGFTQDGESWFTGSRSYLAAWCQTSEKSVSHNLNKLLDKGLIEKRQKSEHGCTFNDYRVTRASMGWKKVPSTGEESSLGAGEESSPHNIERDTTSRNSNIPYVEIVSYLNEMTGRNYDPAASTTRKLIRARWNERARTLEDFKTVIDNKVACWKGTKWEEFLRPSTLFSAKHFDEYLNERQPRSRVDYSGVMDGWQVEHWGDTHGS